MAFSKLDLISEPFQFFIFTRYEQIDNINVMADHLFITVFRFWMPYLIIASLIYLAICGLIIDSVAESMTRPFLELSQRIKLNVKNIQKRKMKTEREERTGSRNKKTMNHIELQVDLLKGYK